MTNLSVLRDAKRIAICVAPVIGDSLLILTLAQTLQDAGRKVTVFADVLWGLRDWLPQFDLRRTDSLPAATDAGHFDATVQLHADKPFSFADQDPDRCVSIYGTMGHYRAPILTQLADFARARFDITDFRPGSPMVAPAGLTARRCGNRVMIHPTASEVAKCWCQHSFARLGERLKAKGLEPRFIVSPAERPAWEWLERRGFALETHASLDQVAALLAETGWFIGNDSGLGHLASALGVPTLSLFPRRSRALRWRSCWSQNAFVYPKFLPLRGLRNRFWRQFVSVGAVYRAFGRLRTDCTAPSK